METRSPGTTEDQLLAMIRREVARAVAEHQRAGILNNAAVTEGNLTIRGGGSLLVEDGGDVQVNDGGDVSVVGGDVNLSDSGDLRVEAGGSIRVARPGGDTDTGNAVYIGPEGGVDTSVVQVLFRREDGSRAFQLRSSSVGPSFWQWLAADGLTELVSEDTVSGTALARPFIPLPMGPSLIAATSAGWPGTTSGSFVTAWEGDWVRMHPRVVLKCATLGDAGATGEVRLVVDNTAIAGTTFSVAANAFNAHEMVLNAWPATVDPFERVQARLEVRRTNASGLARVTFLSAWGIQS